MNSEQHQAAANHFPTPSLADLASAVEYIAAEFDLSSMKISGELWAEGLAFSTITNPSHWAYTVAQEALPQLSKTAWQALVVRAQHMRLTGGFAGC